MMLVFVGAGGSAAVDPEQYPTTATFFQRLPDGIKENPLFVQVCDFLVRTNQHSQKSIDIEDVLGVLNELQADCQKMHDPTTITGCIMGSRDGVIPRMDFAALQQSASLLDREFIAPLIESIYAQVHTWYGGPPHPKKLSVWTQLLTGLRAIDPVLEIFTTNYDIVLEDAIRQAEIPTEIGLTSYREGHGMQTHLWDPANRPETGLLTKLHGSVDWRYLTEDVVVVRDADFSGNRHKHCILYPGYKGVPKEEPFRRFHEHLRRVVQGEYEPLVAAVFIGYAFRDDYINTILSTLTPRTCVYVITKSERVGWPRGIPSVMVDDGLTKDAVQTCLKTIAAHIKRSGR